MCRAGSLLSGHGQIENAKSQQLAGEAPGSAHAVEGEAAGRLPGRRGLVHAQEEARARVGALLRVPPLLRAVPEHVGVLRPARVCTACFGD